MIPNEFSREFLGGKTVLLVLKQISVPSLHSKQDFRLLHYERNFAYGNIVGIVQNRNQNVIQNKQICMQWRTKDQIWNEQNNEFDK